MKVTFVGCGDAFGSGGRGHTCMRIDGANGVLTVDFGATALLGWNRMGYSTNDIDFVALTHLHGDHFGGLPFLLLEAQYVVGRRKPLVIAGPPGTTARVHALCEALFPGMTANRWKYDWSILEVEPGARTTWRDITIASCEMPHPSGAPSTGLRISAGGKLLACTGDTAWTEAILELAADADLLVTECYSGHAPAPHHVDWPTLRDNLPRLEARRIAVTHLGRSALPVQQEMRDAGLIVAEDGASIDL